MNSQTLSLRRSCCAAAACALVVGAVFWGAQGAANAAPVSGAAMSDCSDVQDKTADIELDMKIFVHRHGHATDGTALVSSAVRTGV